MKKFTKHLAAIAMALAVAVTAFVPVTAEAVPNYLKENTVYRTTTDSKSYSLSSIYVSGLSKSDTIKKSSVKTSNKKVVDLAYLEKARYGYESDYFDATMQGNSNDTCGYYIGLNLKKPGKATITFKVGKKKCTSKITVLKWENPLKTAKILGKNHAGRVKNSNMYRGLKTKSTQKNQTVSFATNKNWKITSVAVFQFEDVNETYNYEEHWSYSNAPKKKVSCNIGTVNKNKTYKITVNVTNTKTKASTYVDYYIN